MEFREYHLRVRFHDLRVSARVSVFTLKFSPLSPKSSGASIRVDFTVKFNQVIVIPIASSCFKPRRLTAAWDDGLRLSDTDRVEIQNTWFQTQPSFMLSDIPSIYLPSETE